MVLLLVVLLVFIIILFNSSFFLSFTSLEVNKPAVLKAGTLETICPLLESEMHPVQFKLLGTIRMLIDGQGENSSQSYYKN